MFRERQKTDLSYYWALVFLAYPVSGAFWLSYPLWTLIPTGLFTLSYICLIRLKDSYQKTIAILWFYSLFYIIYTACILDGGFLWFFFFNSNLLIWRFRDKWYSYRTISFLVSILGSSLYIQFLVTDMMSRIMVIVIPTFILLMTYALYRQRKADELKTALYQQHQTINLLSAENERNRIGRDLHDTLGHTFAMMTLKTELAIKQLDKGQLEAVRKELVELNHISRESMQNVRDLVTNLKYRTVEEELHNISDMFEHSDIELRIDNQLETADLSPVLQSSITMILQELTTNVVKHASAKSCQISLWKDQKIRIKVVDDGKGFKELTGKELHSIQERLRLVNGEVLILSSQHPTQIQVSIEEGVMSL